MNYYEESSIRNFKNSYQYLYTMMDSWELYNDREFLIALNNGDTYLYDGIRQVARKIRFIENTRDLTDEEWTKGFSILLTEQLRRKGIQQNELAEMIGTTPRTINRYISCRSVPSIQTVQKIAEVIGCSIDDLCPSGFVYLT